MRFVRKPAKTQLTLIRQVVPPLVVPGAEPASARTANVREPLQQLPALIHQQIKPSIEPAMQQAARCRMTLKYDQIRL